MSEQIAFKQKRATGRPPKSTPTGKFGDIQFFNNDQMLKVEDVTILEYRNNLISFKDGAGKVIHANIQFMFEEK